MVQRDMAYPQIPELYLILTKVATGADFRGYLQGIKSKQQKNTVTYGELSRIYKEVTNQIVDPQFGWTKALGDINTLLALAGLPLLSSVVVCGDAVDTEKQFLPGDGFWTTLGATPDPKDAKNRAELWQRLLQETRHAAWPPFSTIAKNPKVMAFFLKKKK